MPSNAPQSLVAHSSSEEPSPNHAPAAREPAEESELSREVPTECSGVDGCFPDAAFAEKACRGKFPDLPFAMFAKGTPWQRVYVKAEKVEPVNMYRGPRSDTWLHFGEEVIVLRKRGPGTGKGVQMSGPTDLDVLRWDGTCATVREEMFVTYVTGEQISPRIIWKYLDSPIQETLLTSSPIQRAQSAERKQCRDATATQASPECDKARQKLTVAIISAVRGGMELPAPRSVPEWQKLEPTASR